MLVERNPNVQLIHVDASEQHRSLDVQSERHAAFMNEMRFLVPDLILGNINEDHKLYRYLRNFGATEKRLRWFIDNPARIDVLGLDYYAHSELEWNANGRVYPNLFPEGFVSVAMDYVNRFNLPVMLTETNIRGYVSDRLSWLKFMVEQCETLERQLKPRNIPFKGFCWYPFIDSTDWCSLVTRANCNIDPQGIFWLDSDTKKRNRSELSEIFESLARGVISSVDMPAYRFQGPLIKSLKHFLPMMSHWNWRDPLIGEKKKTKRIIAPAFEKPFAGRQRNKADMIS
jgi:hypothetical protein